MKVRELKEILNATTEHDDLEIYASPLIEIDNSETDNGTAAKRLVPELFERYPILKVMQFSPHVESAPDSAMIIGYDDSVNCAAEKSNEDESEEFVN
jgi:hypothetical protein